MTRYGDGVDRMDWRLGLNLVFIECDEDQMMGMGKWLDWYLVLMMLR